MERTNQQNTQLDRQPVLWWVGPPDASVRIQAVGVNPEGDPIWIFPEMLTLPTEIWITRWGFAIDDWKFVGWSLWTTGNMNRFGKWVAAWSRESEDVRPLLDEMMDEFDWRVRDMIKAGTTDEARVFFLKPKPDLYLPLSKGGWIQEEFPF